MADPSTLKRAKEFFTNDVIPWWRDFICKMPEYGPYVVPLLLSGIYLQLQKLTESQQLGVQTFNITPYTLGESAIRVVDVHPQNKPRKVAVWIDAATGGPLPTIRISDSSVGPNGGGLRLTPGILNDIGEVPPQTKLYMAATQAINVYVLERS